MKMKRNVLKMQIM